MGNCNHDGPQQDVTPSELLEILANSYNFCSTEETSVIYPRYMFTCETSSWSVYSVVLWRRKTPIFAIFGLRHLVMSPIGINLKKVEHGCTTTDLPLSSGIKIVSVLQRLHGEIGRTTSDVQKRDGQTNRQKTQRFWPPWRRMKSEPQQTWHGDSGPRMRSCTSKTFGGLTHSL